MIIDFLVTLGCAFIIVTIITLVYVYKENEKYKSEYKDKYIYHVRKNSY